MRTIIELPPPQIERLDAHCAREGISRAEAIRRAVDLMLGTPRALGAGDPAYGLWAGRKPAADGVKYQRALRDEWNGARS
jgi:hypothetical protein